MAMGQQLGRKWRSNLWCGNEEMWPAVALWAVEVGFWAADLQVMVEGWGGRLDGTEQ